LRRLGFAGVTTVLLIVAAVAYLQTADGFARVVRPIAASFFDGELRVARGRLLLTGKLELEGLDYRAVDGTTRLGADRLRLEFAPSVLLFDRHIHGRLLAVEGLELDLRPSSAPSAEPYPELLVTVAEPWLAWVTRLPFSFEHARVRGRSIQVQSDLSQVQLGPAVLEVEGLGVGGVAALKLASDFQIGDRGTPEEYRGRTKIELNGEVSQDGSSFEWDASATSEIQDLTRPELDGSPVRLEAMLRGRLQEGADSPLEMNLRMFDGERSFGRVSGQLLLEHGWRQSSAELGLPESFSASVEIETLSAEALNPALALVSLARLESALLDGAIEVSSQDGVVDLRMDMRGEDWSLRADPESRATAPITFGISERGAWDRKRQQLAVNRAHLEVDRAGVRVLDARLGSRLVVDLDPRGESDRWLGTSMDLKLLVSDLDAYSIDSWMSAFRSSEGLPLQAGSVSGWLAVRIDDEREQILVEGELEGHGLSRRVAEGKRSIDPVDVSVDVRGRLYEGLRVEIESLRLELAEPGGAPIASGSAAGEIDLAARSWSLELVTEIAKPVYTAGRLQLAEIPAALRLETGVARAQWLLERAGTEAPLFLSGGVEVGELAWNRYGGLRRIGPVDLVADFETRIFGDVVAIERGVLEFFEAGDQVAQAELKGELGLATSPSQLELSLEAADLMDVIGRLELVDAPLRAAVGAGPAVVRWSLERAGDRGSWSIAAGLDVETFILTPRPDGWSLGPVELSLHVDARLVDGELLVGESIRLDLVGAEGRAVRADASGQLDLDKGSVRLELVLEAPDLVETFERLELAELADRFGLQGGRGRTHWRLERDDNEAELRMAGELELDELRLSASDPASASRELDAATRLTLRRDIAELELSEFSIELNEAETTRAKLAASGRIPLAQEADRSTGGSPEMGLEVSAAITHLRLDPYIDPWFVTESDEATAVPPPTASEPAGESPNGLTSVPVKVELSLEDVDWREIHVDTARIVASRSGGGRRLELHDARCLGGGMSVEYQHEASPERQEVSWQISGSGLNLAAVARSLEPDEPRRISGMLDLESTGEGAALAGGPLLPQVGGQLEFSVKDGRLQRSGFLSFLSSSLVSPDFQVLAFDTILGRFKIVKGVAEIDELDVSGVGIRLRAEGAIGLNGALNVLVSPRISSNLVARVQIPLASETLRVAGDLFVLPMNYTITGLASDPVYGVAPRMVRGRDVKVTVMDAIGLGRKAIDSVSSAVSSGARAAGSVGRSTPSEDSGDPNDDTPEQAEEGETSQ